MLGGTATVGSDTSDLGEFGVNRVYSKHGKTRGNRFVARRVTRGQSRAGNSALVRYAEVSCLQTTYGLACSVYHWPYIQCVVVVSCRPLNLGIYQQVSIYRI